MGNIQFSNPETKQVWQHLESAARKSHHDHHRIFDDFLTMSICALSGGQMEEEYLETVARYTEGEKGKRACDEIAHAFASLIDVMEETRRDVLGDIFQGAITFGENGQFFTPEHLCTLMAQMTMEPGAKTVSDSCVGSGRILLAAAEINPHAEFYGQDVDHRCVRMTAINLALRNLYGWVIWGDSLQNEEHLIYRTGFNGKGVIAKIEPEDVPEPVQKVIEKLPEGKQMTLF